VSTDNGVIVREALLAAVEKTDRLLKPPMVVPVGNDARLLDHLDSLGLVSLVGAFELELEARLGRPVSLATERAFANERNPFRTLDTLREYAEEVIGGE